MLTKKVILDLQAEANRLRNQARLIDTFLAGIEDEQTDSVGVPPSEDDNGSFAGQIRTALRQLGRTTTSRQVEDQLIQNGAEATKQGKPLRHFISVSLHSMADKNTGGVKRVARGRYRIETNSHEAG